MIYNPSVSSGNTPVLEEDVDGISDVETDYANRGRERSHVYLAMGGNPINRIDPMGTEAGPSTNVAPASGPAASAPAALGPVVVGKRLTTLFEAKLDSDDQWSSNFQLLIFIGEDLKKRADEIKVQQYYKEWATECGITSVIGGKFWQKDLTRADGYYKHQDSWKKGDPFDFAKSWDLPNQGPNWIGGHPLSALRRDFKTDVVVTAGPDKGKVIFSVLWSQDFNWSAKKPYVTHTLHGRSVGSFVGASAPLDYKEELK